MNKYELEVPKIVMDYDDISIVLDNIQFCEISYEQALHKAQQIINERKETFMKKLDDMLDENLITHSEKDLKINKYPTRFKFVETRTCVNYI